MCGIFLLTFWRRVGCRQRINGRRRGVLVQLTPHQLCRAGTAGGPRTDPCGTPHTTEWRAQVTPFKETVCCLSRRNDLSHASTDPPIANKVSRRTRGMSWSTTSKAAFKSRDPEVSPDESQPRRECLTAPSSVRTQYSGACGRPIDIPASDRLLQGAE